jgi:hypothetical protein
MDRLNVNGLVSLTGSNEVRLSLETGMSVPAPGVYPLITTTGAAPVSGLALQSLTVGTYAASLVWNANDVSVELLPYNRVSITGQPQPLQLVWGSAGSLSVSAASSLPIGYQWYRNGAEVSGGTGAVLSFGSIRSADAGTYHVVATAGAWVATSVGVTVGVNVPLPAGLTVEPGTALATVSGGSFVLEMNSPVSGEVGYQWLFNGTLRAGETSRVLNLSGLRAADSGDYQVRVTNESGSIDSPVTQVSVLEVLQQPQGVTLAAGGTGC